MIAASSAEPNKTASIGSRRRRGVVWIVVDAEEHRFGDRGCRARRRAREGRLESKEQSRLSTGRSRTRNRR